MTAYALTYSMEAHVAERGGAGGQVGGLALVPALDSVMHLEHPHTAVYRRPVGFAVRQMVNRELNLESIRKASRTMKGEDAESVPETEGAGGGSGDNKRAREDDVGPKLVEKYNQMSRKKTTNLSLQFDVLYRYNEGFTNAVRRNVTLESLWKPAATG
jgi:hypothetical protein